MEIKVKLKYKQFSKRMTEKGYDNISLSKSLNCSPSYVSMMRNGKRQPSHSLARKILKVLDVEYTQLFEEEN